MDYELLARVASGVLLLAGGWILYRAGIRVVGFLLGFFIGLLFSLTLLRALEIMEVAPGLQQYRNVIAVGLAIMHGLLNAVFIIKLYYLVVAAAFGLVGWAFHQGYLVPSVFEGGLPAGLGVQIPEPWLTIGIVAVFAIVGVLLHKYLVILLTAAAGAALVVSALPPDDRLPALTPVLAAAGILVQFLISRKVGVPPQSLRKAAKEAEKGKAQRGKQG